MGTLRSDALAFAKTTKRGGGRACQSCLFFRKNARAREWFQVVLNEIREGRADLPAEPLRAALEERFGYPGCESALKRHVRHHEKLDAFSR